MLLANRSGFLVKKPITAKNYVQDGLVAMWDGIENAGYGVHDSSATTWKDLVGNYDLSIVALTSNVAFWEENGFKFNKRTQTGSEYFWYCTNTNLQTRLEQTLTYEMKISINSDSLRNYASFNGNSGVDGLNGFFSSVSPTRNRFEIGTTTRAPTSGQSGLITVPSTSVIGKNITITYTANTSGTILFIDATLVGTGEAIAQLKQNEFCLGSSVDYNGDGSNPNLSQYYRTPLATFHCVRIYSRALTAEEIAANIAVDKERFGLT